MVVGEGRLDYLMMWEVKERGWEIVIYLEEKNEVGKE